MLNKQSFPQLAEQQPEQDIKLKELLHYVSVHSPFYKNLLSENKINIQDINGTRDLHLLPTTCKDDIQKFNTDFLCVPPADIIEYTSTSGTLGRPVTGALTEQDLQRLALNEYNSFLLTDATQEDVFQLMVTLDKQFMAGIAYYSGIRKLGGAIIRLGPSSPAAQWESILRYKTSFLIGIPSFLLKMIDYAKETGIELNKTTVKKALCIGEPIRNPDFSMNTLGRRIADAWSIKLFSTYASTEMQTAFTECNAGMGGHLQSDLLIAEILDENNKSLPQDEFGEVVITTLGVQGMPLLRYKTGDIARLEYDPCSCGRYSPRISPIVGRKQYMIKLKGTTLYPPALFEVLSGIHFVKDYAIEVFSTEIGLDDFTVYICSEVANADIPVQEILHSKLRVTPHVKHVSVEQLHRMHYPEGMRKAIRFIDRRNQF